MLTAVIGYCADDVALALASDHHKRWMSHRRGHNPIIEFTHVSYAMFSNLSFIPNTWRPRSRTEQATDALRMAGLQRCSQAALSSRRQSCLRTIKRTVRIYSECYPNVIRRFARLVKI